MYISSGGVANSTNVNSGGTLFAQQKSLLSNTIINNVGIAQVSYAASAYDTVVNSGGKLIAYYYKPETEKAWSYWKNNK
jgi:autotransporter passenger strand-loop-strand repeat protein